jgi:hypothetical protein
MVGNGSGDEDRHNALQVDWDGNLKVSGEPPIRR